MFGDFNTNIHFRKTSEICETPTETELSWLKNDKAAFASSYKNAIEEKIASHGYTLREAGTDDVYTSYQFSSQQYGKELADAISAYDIYRFICFGHGLIIEDQQKKIQGCLFEAAYDTHEKTSLSIRLAIDKILAGKDFGSLITTYSCLLAMEDGSRTKRGFIELGNDVQLYIQLNKVGWIIDDYFDDIQGLVPTFTVVLPLDPESLILNKIKQEKCQHYLKNMQEGTDYMLLESNNAKLIKKIYRETEYKIVAFLKPGIAHKEARLLALPAEKIGMK